MKKSIVLCLALCLWGINSFAKEKNEASTRTIDDRVASIADYKNDTLRAFYDLNWNKPTNDLFARYFSVAYKMADGWVCKDYRTIDSKIRFFSTYRDQELKIKEGTCAYFYANGKIAMVGHYINNKKSGKWMKFEFDGTPVDTVNYLNGIPFDENYVYSHSGKMLKKNVTDSVGIGTETSFYENGTVKIKGFYGAGMVRDSIWTSFFQNGNIACKANFYNDSLVKSSCLDINGTALKKCTILQPAEFRGGEDGLQEYINKMNIPYNLRKKNPINVTVVFCINEEGRTENIRIEDSDSPEANEAVIKEIKEMKPWKPALEFNLPVTSIYVLPITFMPSEY